MKTSHEQYLKETLESRRLQLEELDINHRVSIAKYETKREMLVSQINSIENQLETD